MTDPVTEPPDYVTRTYSSSVRTNLVTNTQLAGLSQEQTAKFNQWNQNVATKDELAQGSIPVAGSGVTGAVNTNTVGVSPATSVAVSTTNMMVSQNFTSAGTVAAQMHWSWDGTDGNLNLGCARVDCDGYQDDLVSNEIPVVVGETIEVACQVKWENISYTGTDNIVLGVEKYRKGRDRVTGGVTYLDLGGADLATIESPAANGGWGTDGDLAAVYVVEPGVDQLRFRFRAAPNITAGTVKWDEAVFLKLDLIDDAAVPGVGTTVDNIVQELYGTAGSGFTHNDAAVALGNTQAALLSVNARVSAVEAEASPGAVAGDDFIFTGEVTANSNWGGSYGIDQSFGHYTVSDGDAVWVPTGVTLLSANQTCTFDWQGTDSVSTTDYQLVQLLLSSAPVTGPNNFVSWVHVLGRISSGFGSYVRAGFGSDGTYFVDYWNGSSFSTMRSGTCTVPGSGSLISLYCGIKESTALRRFKLKVNQTIIAEFNEVGTGSPVGASNRKWGWGAKANGGFYPVFLFIGNTGQGTPPKINQWLGYDQ